MKDQLETLFQSSEATRLAVSIITDGYLADVYTFEKPEAERMQRDTLWKVASLTKPVFVYGVMGLVESGLLELDRPMQEYLPTPYADVDFIPEMTVRQAMCHATGLPNWRDEYGLRAAFKPGTKFSYSSEGLTYLQYVVEQVTRLPLSEYLQQQVFHPFEMKNTYLAQEAQDELPPMLHFLQGTLLANGALSLRTTVEDYARFMVAMLIPPPENAPLKSEMVNEMLQSQIAVGDVPSLYWGLGWGLQHGSSRKSFWHWGARSIPKTMNFAMGIPGERKAIVIFTNHANGLYLCKNVISEWIGETILPAFEWLLPAQEWRPDGKKHD